MAREDYAIYVHWYQTLDTLLSRAEAFPRSARFTLASGIADAGLDVMEGIVRSIYTRDLNTTGSPPRARRPPLTGHPSR